MATKLRRTKKGTMLPSKKQKCGLATASKLTRKRVATLGVKAKKKRSKKKR